MEHLLPIHEVAIDLDIDCVVVGAGACGLVAALSLSDAGIDTLLLERDNKPAGSTSMSSGFIPAADTRLQRSLGVEDSAHLFAQDIQRKADNEADPVVVKAVTEGISRTLDWLESTHGLQWILLQDFLYPGHSAHRMHTVPGKTGEALLAALLQANERAGTSLACSARVDRLLVDVAGSAQPVVCGVRISRSDGSFEHVRARAVVLACNGYGASQAMMQRFIPAMAEAYYHGHTGNTGDAINWGQQLDVPLLHMGAYQGHGSVAAGHNILITWALMMEGGVQVNLLGRRFSNEHGGYSEQAVAVMNQPDSLVWNIYDERLHRMGLEFPDYCDAFKAGAVVTAENATELAAVTGLPTAALTQTLADINALSDSNDRDSFGRQFNLENKLKSPFFAIKVKPAVFHTQGGLSIDAGARVLRADQIACHGLYAAGGAACGVSGATVKGYLSGNGLLTAIALGKIAAESVAADIR